MGIMLLSSFSRLRDPRIARHRRYLLSDLLFIALCAMLCGADSFVEIEAWARAKQFWLRERLDLPDTLPSHDTFGRVFARLDARLFADCFHQWTQAIAERTKGDVIAIDGKEIRHSFDLSTGQAALHLVSAWACRQHLVLEQEAVSDKSNEITAIPVLLSRLDIDGCLVTIDAMGCQRAIADQIVEQKGDYCLALKGNQRDLHDTVKGFFTTSRAAGWKFGEGVLARPIEHFRYQSVEEGHGRRETRRCFVAKASEAWLTHEQLADWPGLLCVACVESERTIRSRLRSRQGHPASPASPPLTTIERRYFLTSLKPGRFVAREVLRAVRSHWGIENGLHWVLDVAFREDESRVRRDNAQNNLATLRRLSLALLKQDKTAKGGVKAKRLQAGWNNDFLLTLLAGQQQDQQTETKQTETNS